MSTTHATSSITENLMTFCRQTDLDQAFQVILRNYILRLFAICKDLSNNRLKPPQNVQTPDVCLSRSSPAGYRQTFS